MKSAAMCLIHRRKQDEPFRYMYPQRKEKISHIALAALHRRMVTRVCQLDELAARYDALGQYKKAARYVSLSNQTLSAFGELKRRMLRLGHA